MVHTNIAKIQKVTSTHKDAKIRKHYQEDNGLSFLHKTHHAVRAEFSNATDLATFLNSAEHLSLDEKLIIVEQALLLFSENFVHLPLKESMHGVNPVQKLRLLQHRIKQTTDNSKDDKLAFHREMLEIFNSVRDLHTNYLLPLPFAGKIAFLPFLIEEYFINDEPHYIVTKIVEGFIHPHFQIGVEVHMWNGAPINNAIRLAANMHAGSNLAARHVRGLDALTIRSLSSSLPPDSYWVQVGYTDLDGVQRELRQHWAISSSRLRIPSEDANSLSVNAVSQALDLEAYITQETKKLLFAPEVIQVESTSIAPVFRKALGQILPSTMGQIFRAQNITTLHGEFGHIRIFSFNIDDPEVFINEFIRLVEQLSQNGLIIDVRGNGGGHIWASEGLLQVLTPFEISPEPTQFINTPLNLRICKRHENNPTGQIELGPWVPSIQRSIETGAVYSSAHPITPINFANRIGQKYHGPVVLITDARCYSATDIFAAGFKDHEIGHILGVDDYTGAGGANVWTHGLLQTLLTLPRPSDPESPYTNLPAGANMRVAIRRTLRVGQQSGTPVEDLGVMPDTRYQLTKDDLLEGNIDLFNQAGLILSNMPIRKLVVSATISTTSIAIQAEILGLSRLDIYLDSHPIGSIEVSDGTQSFDIEKSDTPQYLECAGYDGENYVASRLIDM